MDFVGGGGSGGSTTSAGGTGGLGLGVSLGSENGPILYTESNRTSAIDDIRSVVIYIFIITIFVSFFLILPGIRNEKFPTFLCITTSLIVTSIILVSLFGTTWHVGQASVSVAYKAFSVDRIQGELSVRIGLQSVNITLRAHKYYALHASKGPVIMENYPTLAATTTAATTTTTKATTQEPDTADHSLLSRESSVRSDIIPDDEKESVGHQDEHSTSRNNETPKVATSSLADELLGVGSGSDATTVDTELEVEEVFAKTTSKEDELSTKSSNVSASPTAAPSTRDKFKKRSTITTTTGGRQHNGSRVKSTLPRYTIERHNIDINYNERFYWIGPDQMRQEHRHALERGLPYPILTVVEYLSQDDAGFSWSRQYRLAGYYSYIILWSSLGVCALMFFLHCAAPKYGIYTMQLLGCLLLFTNFTYALLVPRGEQKLVIPFEGQTLSFKFGWNFWLVLIGGKC